MSRLALTHRTPGEVAASVGFLCLPSSGGITGETIAIAGGEVS